MSNRNQLAAQLAQLGDLCSCRQSAQCRQLLDQLGAIGAIPTSVLTMTDVEWAAACLAQRTGSIVPILPAGQP